MHNSLSDFSNFRSFPTCSLSDFPDFQSFGLFPSFGLSQLSVFRTFPTFGLPSQLSVFRTFPTFGLPSLRQITPRIYNTIYGTDYQFVIRLGEFSIAFAFIEALQRIMLNDNQRQYYPFAYSYRAAFNRVFVH
jgi:hypothetical protein